MHNETIHLQRREQYHISDTGQIPQGRLRNFNPEMPMRSEAAEELAFAKTKIAVLELELDERDREIETLRENVSALMTSLCAQEPSESGARQQGVAPTTVAEAIALARATLSDSLVFNRKVDDQIASLKGEAGPPEKLMRYLSTLADLSSELLSGKSLQASIPTWLRARGVESSRESDRNVKSKAARRRRTFAIGGRDIYCEFHAKPNDGAHPDQCIRIFFAPMADGRIGIGYIGRHFD